MKQTYSHAFSAPGLVCAFTWDDDGLGPGRAAMVDVQWSRKIEPHERARVLAEYLAWKAEIFQAAANRTRKRIMDAVEVERGEWLALVYEPEGAA